MVTIARDANTHAVGNWSLILGAVAILAPALFDWLVPVTTVPAPVHDAVHQVCSVIVAFALGGAYVGKPSTVPSGPPSK